MFQYRAYNLNIHSELKLREYPECANEYADVTIQFGPVHEELASEAKRRVNCQGLPGFFRMEIPGVARCLVGEGKRITIDRHSKASDNQIVILTTGTLIAALLQQRKHLTIHASCVKGPDGAILFMGHSGIGKSTLLSEMLKRRFQMIADNVSPLVEREDGNINVIPSAPTVRLWEDSIEALQVDRSCGWKVRRELEVLNLPVDDFHPTPIAVSNIFILDHSTHSGHSTETVGASDAHHALRNLTYRKHFYNLMGLSAFHFSMISRVVSQVPVFKLTRQDNAFEPEKLADAVETAVELQRDGTC